MIPAESIARWPVSGHVRREMWPTGGHVGFVGRTHVPGRFWAAERLLDFFDDALAT
jgi:predicted alpha/beta-fold hydrolase